MRSRAHHISFINPDMRFGLTMCDPLGFCVKRTCFIYFVKQTRTAQTCQKEGGGLEYSITKKVSGAILHVDV